MSIFEKLSAEFPRDSVHWRAQTLTQDGSKALALAYIDARDVQDRLDEVCGAGGWRNAITETAKGRVICTIEIKIGDEWIGKTDGAGDTAVEGEKGGISDAFKRAAVLWGVGRYLYRMPDVWAPCEFKEYNGKKQWKAWKGSPWDAMRNPSPEPKKDPPAKELIATLAKAAEVTIQTICESYNVSSLDELKPAQAEAIVKRLNLTIKDKTKENA
jgi:hypothetical protein